MSDCCRAGDSVGVEVVRAGANQKMEDGQMKMTGLYTIEVIRDGRIIEMLQSPNIITKEGRRHILQIAMTGGSNLAYDGTTPTLYKAKPYFYVYLSAQTAFTPAEGQTYAAPQALEYTGQAETPSLPKWNGVLDATESSMTNTALKASFTITTPATITGAGMVSAVTKGQLGQAFTTAQNVLISYSNFGSSIGASLNDVVNVTIALQLA